MRDHEESQTAALVCAGRALADGRAVERFADPTAAALLPPDWLAKVERLRAGGPPPRGRAAIESGMLRATAGIIVPRTVAIDDAVREAGAPQLVILGAGLDGRAWRLAGLAATTVFEVDHPASQAAKKERSAGLAPTARELRFVPVDFGRDDLGQALAAAGHDAGAPTTWVWEGVVPYLTADQVRATLAVVAARSAPASVLVIAYNSPGFGRHIGRLVSRLTAPGRSRGMLAAEPQRSFYTAARMRGLLERYGFAVRTDRDLVDLAREIGADVPSMGAFARAGRVVVAARRG
jgi:methyltransferase (TIGR00027 family)